MKRQLKGLVQRGVGQGTDRRSNPIEKIMLTAAGLSRQPTEVQVDALASAVNDALQPLLGVAMSGNVKAIRHLTEITSHLCAEALLLACMHQEAANTVARERTTWPLNVPADAAARRRALRLVTGPRKLPLGLKAAPARDDRRAYNLAGPANAAVLMALKAIEIERSFRVPSELFPTLQPDWSVAAAQLPELSAASAEAWTDVIWLYVCQRHDGAPECSPLRKLVEPDPAGQPLSDAAARRALRETFRACFLRLWHGRKKPRRRAG